MSRGPHTAVDTLRCSQTSFGTGVLNLGTTDFWIRVIFGGGDHPVQCEMLSSTSGFEPLDANSTPPPSYDNQKCLLILPNAPGGVNHLG